MPKRQNDEAQGSEFEPETAKILQKRQFLAQIAKRAGVRTLDARHIVDATLAELGDAVAAGKTLALPPLGRARIERKRDIAGSDIIVIRLRRRTTNAPAWQGDEQTDQM